MGDDEKYRFGDKRYDAENKESVGRRRETKSLILILDLHEEILP